MVRILIEVEAYKRELSIKRFKELSDKIENTLSWFGFKDIKINIKKKDINNEMV